MDRKTWSDDRRPVNFNGKAVALEHFNTRFLIDDNLDIVEECCESGILAYKCAPGRSRRREKEYRNPLFEREELEHPSGSSFNFCVEDVISDRRSGDLWRKLHILEQSRRY